MTFASPPRIARDNLSVTQTTQKPVPDGLFHYAPLPAYGTHSLPPSYT